jgi:hypothetical protein
MKDSINATIISVSVIAALTIGTLSYHNHLNQLDLNERNEKIESIRVQKQHELEVTKQRAIELNDSKKRKIWERAMPEGEDSSLEERDCH